MNKSKCKRKRDAISDEGRPCKRQRANPRPVETVNQSDIGQIEEVSAEQPKQETVEAKVKKYIKIPQIKEILIKRSKRIQKELEQIKDYKARRVRRGILDDVEAAIDEEMRLNDLSLVEAAIVIDRRIRHCDIICAKERSVYVHDPPPSISEIFRHPTPNLYNQNAKTQKAIRNEQIKYRTKPMTTQCYEAGNNTKIVKMENNSSKYIFTFDYCKNRRNKSVTSTMER